MLSKDVVALAANDSAARRVTARADVPGDLPVVSGDRVQLQQVLLNLVMNGMDAMNSVDEPERLLEIRGRRGTQDGTPVATIIVQEAFSRQRAGICRRLIRLGGSNSP